MGTLQAGTPPRQVSPRAGTPPGQVHPPGKYIPPPPMVNAWAVSILLECIPVYYFVRTVKQKSHWPNISLIDTYYIIKVVCYYHIAKLNKLSSITFTTRKRSCGKVMFLKVSVILFPGGGGGVVSQHASQVT